MLTSGDLIRYRRVQVRPERAGTGEPAYDWVDDYGIILESRGFPRASGKDYLVRVYFPASTQDFTGRGCGRFRTLRASKITEVLDSPVPTLVESPIGGVDDLIPF